METYWFFRFWKRPFWITACLDWANRQMEARIMGQNWQPLAESFLGDEAAPCRALAWAYRLQRLWGPVAVLLPTVWHGSLTHTRHTHSFWVHERWSLEGPSPNDILPAIKKWLPEMFHCVMLVSALWSAQSHSGFLMSGRFHWQIEILAFVGTDLFHF